MKLRNKRTGEIVELSDEEYDAYEIFAKLMGDYNTWVEYNPAEPLIKDEKVRKAVRVWAEANKIIKCKCTDEVHCLLFETKQGMFISFENADPVPPEGNFTIAELCGEED